VDVYTTEEEQIEAIKKWWRENWKSLAGGVILGIAILWAGKSYLQNREIETGNAAFQFDALMQAMAQNKPEEAAKHAEVLNSKYANTPFAVASALAMAKLKVEGNDMIAAESYLRWAMEKADNDALKNAARLRLARVLLATNKTDEALKMVSVSADKSAGYAASYQELKGDILVAQGKVSEAISAYNLALAELDQSDRGRKNLQMKLDDLGALDNAKQAS